VAFNRIGRPLADSLPLFVSIPLVMLEWNHFNEVLHG